MYFSLRGEYVLKLSIGLGESLVPGECLGGVLFNTGTQYKIAQSVQKTVWSGGVDMPPNLPNLLVGYNFPTQLRLAHDGSLEMTKLDDDEVLWTNGAPGAVRFVAKSGHVETVDQHDNVVWRSKQVVWQS